MTQDVKCPECSHEAGEHISGTGCAAHVSNGDNYGFGPTLCVCGLSEVQSLRAALAAAEERAAKAEREIDEARLTNRERHATINFLRSELAERSADYADMLRERNEARDEVERLRNDLLDALDVKDGTGPTALTMLRNDRDELQRDIAAERQWIASLFRAHCKGTGRCENEKSYCGWCATADRIATGYYAQDAQEGGRDGE